MLLLYKSGFALVSGLAIIYLQSYFHRLHEYSACVAGLALLWWLSWKISGVIAKYGIIKRLPRIDANKKAILITGCDTGFGQMFALSLNKKGFSVYATCLYPDGEGAIVLKINAACPEKMTILEMDVTSDASVTGAFNQIADMLREKNEQLWGLVNNAGIARCGEVEWGQLEKEHSATLEVNTVGILRVTRKFLPLVRKAKGRVVNMASVAGRLTFPLFSSYSMTKYGVISFTDGLRLEMQKFGVKVISIEPFIYKTAMICSETTRTMANCWRQTSEEIKRDYTQRYFDALSWYVKTFVGSALLVKDSPQEVVAAVEDAFESPRPEYSYVPCTWFFWPLFWMGIYVVPHDLFEFYMKYYTYTGKLLMLFFNEKN